MAKEADKGKVSVSTLGQPACAALLSPERGLEVGGEGVRPGTRESEEEGVRAQGVRGGGCAAPGVGRRTGAAQGQRGDRRVMPDADCLCWVDLPTRASLEAHP